jgi:hypothetical protein
MFRVRPPAWALFVIGTVLVLLALMGITNSVHVMARVVYAILMLAGVGCGVLGFRKRQMSGKACG